MSRKMLFVFLAAVLFSLMPSAAQAMEGCETEAECEAELFPFSPESEADWSFDMSVAPNATEQQCLQAKAACDSACMIKGATDVALCMMRYWWSPVRLAICYSVAMSGQARCHLQCQIRADECLSYASGGGGGPFDPLNQDPGSGGGCGLSAEYAYSCWGP